MGKRSSGTKSRLRSQTVELTSVTFLGHPDQQTQASLPGRDPARAAIRYPVPPRLCLILPSYQLRRLEQPVTLSVLCLLLCEAGTINPSSEICWEVNAVTGVKDVARAWDNNQHSINALVASSSSSSVATSLSVQSSWAVYCSFPPFFSILEPWCLPLSFRLSAPWLRSSYRRNFMRTDWRYTAQRLPTPVPSVGRPSLKTGWELYPWTWVGRQLRHAYKKGAVSSGGKSGNYLPFRSGDGHVILKQKEADRVKRKRRTDGNTWGRERSRRTSKRLSSQTETKGIKTQGEQAPCHWKERHNFHSLNFPEKRNKWKRQASSREVKRPSAKKFWRKLYFSSLQECEVSRLIQSCRCHHTPHRKRRSAHSPSLLFLICVRINIPLAKAPVFSNCWRKRMFTRA